MLSKLHHHWKLLCRCLCGGVLLGLSSSGFAEQEQGSDHARLYDTRESQRDAGIEHTVWPGSSIRGLLEFDWNGGRTVYIDPGLADRESNQVTSLQLELDTKLNEVAEIELILDYETETKRLEIDEFTLGFDLEPWEITLGRQYTPFGQYVSYFLADPIIEFAETRELSLMVSYAAQHRYGFSAALYSVETSELDDGVVEDEDVIDGTLAFKAWPTERIQLGMAYQTDLANAGRNLFEVVDRPIGNKVPGLAAYLVWVGEQQELSLEVIGALRPFTDVDEHTDQPLAWNIELSIFPHPKLDLALRLEGSRELLEEPAWQAGMALTYRFSRHATLTLDYLHGRFDVDLTAEDEGDRPENRDRLGAQITIAF